MLDTDRRVAVRLEGLTVGWNTDCLAAYLGRFLAELRGSGYLVESN